MAPIAIRSCNYYCKIILFVVLIKLVVISTCRPISKGIMFSLMFKADYDVAGLIRAGASSKGGYGDILLESKGYRIMKDKVRIKVGGGLKNESNEEMEGLEKGKVEIKVSGGLENEGNVDKEVEIKVKVDSGINENVASGQLSDEEDEEEEEEEEEEEDEGVPSALLVFGDSTVDAGTNKHLLTISRSDFTPYGRDFASKQPTGRFCNGLLVTDYLASMMGLQSHTIAYLDIKYSVKLFEKPLKMEVSFASASSGIFESTAQHFNALPLSKQMEHFKEYKNTLIETFGHENSLKLMKRAIFIISTGTNDFLNNYFLNPYLRARYNHQEFHTLLLGLCAKFIQELYDLGARKIGLVSLPPFGCLPVMITLYMHGEIGCVEHLNQQAIEFNKGLQDTMHRLESELIGLKLAYIDSYNVLMDAIQNPKTYGLEHTKKACCGSGKLEVGLFCNKLTIGTCDDATSYIFWDSFHLTDSMNQIMALNLFDPLLNQLHIREQGVRSCKDVLKNDKV